MCVCESMDDYLQAKNKEGENVILNIDPGGERINTRANKFEI